MKILVVEDEVDLLDVITQSLTKDGYVVESTSTYHAAKERIMLYEYDCILLDIMLPDGSGLDLLKELKQSEFKDVHGGVIVISARNSVEDKIEGLDLGADDYLAKPFHLSELSARVKSVIRRGRQGGNASLSLGNVEVQTDSRRVFVGGEEVVLSRKEYDVLLYFIQREGHVISKEALAEGVWGDYIDQADSFDFIYAQLKNLRRKLSAASSTMEIKSIYGFGYKVVGS